jgi:hypothetical protein
MRNDEQVRAVPQSLQVPVPLDLSYAQELLDCPARIMQADLSELQQLERAYALAKDDFRSAREQSFMTLYFETFRADAEGGPGDAVLVPPESRLERARAYAVAKNDFESAHAQIFEMLMFGFPGDGGPLVARLERGHVVVEDTTAFTACELSPI